MNICDFIIVGRENALREQEQREWISVKERLPKVGRDVIGIDAIGFINTVVWSGVKWLVAWDGDESYRITHWMPLPEPPKED